MATTVVSPSSGIEPAGAPSTSDLLNMITPEMMSSAGAIQEPAKEGYEPDAPVDDGQIDTPDDTPAETTPEPEAEPEPAAPPEEDKKVDAAPPAEELPEGVTKGKNRKGEEGYFTTPERWETVYGAYKASKEISNLLGEPLTVDAVKAKIEAGDAFDGLMVDLTSGDKSQGNALEYLMARMNMAHKNGETAVDPAVSFVDTLYSKLAGSGTAAERTMRLRNTHDLVNEMFEAAAASRDDALAAGIQQVVRHLAGIGPNETNPAVVKAAADRLGLPFRMLDELPTLAQGTSPEAQLRAENARLKQQLNGNGKSAPAGVESFPNWAATTNQAVEKSVLDSVILPALAAQKDAWAKIPDGEKQFQLRVINPLQLELKDVLAKDERYQSQLTSLKDQAKRAVSADMRKRLGEQIVNLTMNRAKLSIDTLKVPHVKFAAELVKQQADSAHQRRSSAQQKAVPRGASAPVNRGLVPNANEVTYQNGVFDPATAMKDMQASLTRLVR